MIKLTYPEKPKKLTDTVVAKLTAEFKASKAANKEKSVWKKKYITDVLLGMSSHKCCFCEANVNQESKYMEVEHFHPKSLYEDEVVVWENLLPICKRCNDTKLNHDTIQKPIIHPAKNNPKEHLKLQFYRFRGITDLGKLTIAVVGLNDKQRLVDVRYEIGDKLIRQLESLLKLTYLYDNTRAIEDRNHIVEFLKNLMREGVKESPYSATVATVLLEDDNYQEIKQLFEKNNLWSNEFKELEKQVKFCALIP